MKKTWPDVVVGSVWRDRDPRMRSGQRLVCVTAVTFDRSFTVGTGTVAYQEHPQIPKDARMFHSKYDRFQRAFELVRNPGPVEVTS